MTKTHYSASELLAMNLEGLPTSKKGVLLYLERNAWQCIEVLGNGGRRKEYAPPESIMAQIRARAMRGVLNEAKALPVPAALKVVPDPVSGQLIPADQQAIALTSAEKLQADCRKGILLAIEKLMAGCGVGKEAAITAVLVEAKKEPEGQLARTFRLASTSGFAMSLARPGRSRLSRSGVMICIKTRPISRARKKSTAAFQKTAAVPGYRGR